MSPSIPPGRTIALLFASTALLLAACGSPPRAPGTPSAPNSPNATRAPERVASPPVAVTAPPASDGRAAADSRTQAAAPPAARPRASNAATPRDYRRDAAQHLYGLNRDRIFPGRLPPMLYAIGVLQVDVDGTGAVRQLTWMREPRHAPEVVAEIERTVRAAAPFPTPARMGRVTYTDTWLWDRSGRFQLDTLTEGQD